MQTISTDYLTVATASTCFLAGLIPTIGTELYLIGIASLVTPVLILPLAFLGALSQTLAKLLIYFFAKQTIYCLSFKRKRQLIQLKKCYADKNRLTHSIIFISALTGLPPYYLVNIICGLFDTGWISFAILGISGMFIRFSLCLAFANEFMSLMHWRLT